ncbi:hypothetical protein OOT46_26550 [Aquabacterium sp. A7-Y]|uniref:hypothetical protein n=1 Tax=Aquabacterium sp. A7-Y TaxID=1349605 RepID=UPI00223DA6C1|nr:hypothetical protein [Aquabacterium sp. A7-Y]MCW7541377.1 hypothetical protein [Aquabacterium sp. A7-Y]
MSASAPPIRAGTPLLEQGIRAVNFFNGRLVSSRDLSRDQEARREGDARLGQASGAGVVSGLEVLRHGAPADRRLQIRAGLALNRAGQTLCLGTDQVLALVPQADDPTPDSGDGFGACRPLSGGSYVAGDGLYLVTLAPVVRGEGQAEVLALEPGNLRCNTDVMVEAVQLRLLRVSAELLEAHGLDSNAVGEAAVSRLRSAAAAACFGQAQQAVAHTRPGRPAAPGLLDDMRGRGLDDCDVPLALVYLNASQGLVFVDRWAVRRRVAAGGASPTWAAWLGEARDAVAHAQLAQFQEQLLDVPAGLLPGLRAVDWFTWLPPAGFLDVGGPRQVDWQAFLGERQPMRTVPLAPGDAPAVLAQALQRDAVALSSASATPRFRVYRIDDGPWFFVREAPNAPHAEEVWLDGERAHLPGVSDVQAAIDALSSRSCRQLVLRPDSDEARAQALLDALPEGTHLMLCIEAGTLALKRPLQLRRLGHVTVHGHGAGSLLHCASAEVALHVEACASLTIEAVALRADHPGQRKAAGIGLLGALTVADTPDVQVRRVSARCGHGGAFGAAAVVVTHHGTQGGRRRVQVEDCELQVGSGQQGLLCIHTDITTVRGNTVAALDSKRPMLRGIVVAGDVAREVCVAHNVVEQAAQGITVALPRREDQQDPPLTVEHGVLIGNRITVEVDVGDRAIPGYGLFVGNVLSLLVQANRISAGGTPGGTQLLRGLYLNGLFGRRLALRDNHFSALAVGIEVVAQGDLPGEPGECLWIAEANLAEHAQEVLVADELVMALLRRQNNVVTS